MRGNLQKAEMGMGTLIIFIAMILVAAVAAAVLITTTSSLQNKALDTGRSTTQEVGTSLQVLEIYGEDGADTTIENLFTTMKLSAGSEPIRFTDMLITLSLDNASQDYEFNTSVVCATNATFNNATDGFGVQYQINGTDNADGYLTRGDVVKLCIYSPREIQESESFRISFIPKVGTPLAVSATTPDLILKTRETLYP